MQDYKTEDTVILIDTSRSMLRKDFKPDRLNVAVQTAIRFIKRKFEVDPSDRIAVITFGRSTKKLSSFSFEEEKLINVLKKIDITGKGSIQDGIAFALQLLVEEMRKIGGKLQRIFLISDDKLKVEHKRLKKMLNIAKGLGVYIDACQLGKTQDYKESTLKKIAQTTKGEFGYFTNSKAARRSGEAFASKKTIKDSNDYFSPDKKEDKAPLISEIAMSLRRPTVMEIRLMMGSGGRGQDKCQICHSIKSPITQADFFSEGRYCPSCDRAMHLSCAAQWANKSEHKNNIFRCPFCFFLLELPKSINKLIKPKQKKEEQKIRIISDEEGGENMNLVSPEEVEKINASCSFCHNIFLGEYKVFQCTKCGAYYHEPCLEKMNEDVHACRNCGTKISLN